MATNNVELRISATGADQVEQQVRTIKRSLDDIGASADKSSDAFKRMAAAFTASNLITKALESALGYLQQMKQYIEDSAKYAAKVETLGVAMKAVGNNAGYTAAQMLTYEKQVKDMGITTEAARSSLTMMAGAQLKVADAAKLARVAQDAAVIGGINSSEAFQRMVQGIRSGELEVLKTIGINVSFEGSYKKLAAQIGVASDKLTESQKILARQNAVMEYGVNIQGTYEAAMGTTGKQLQSLQRYYDEVKLAFGEAFAPALGALVTETTEKLKALLKHFEDNRGAYRELAKNLADIVKGAAHPIEAVKNAFKAPWQEPVDVDNSYNNIEEARLRSRQAADEARRIDQANAARAAREAEEKKLLAKSKDDAAKKAADALKKQQEQAARVGEVYQQLRNEIDRLNPSLTDHQKKVLAVEQEYGKAAKTVGINQQALALLKQQALDTLEALRMKDITASVADAEQAVKQMQTLVDAPIKAPDNKQKLSLLGSFDLMGGTTPAERLKALQEEIALLKEKQAIENEILDKQNAADILTTSSPYQKQLKMVEESYRKEIKAEQDKQASLKAEREKGLGNVKDINAQIAASVKYVKALEVAQEKEVTAAKIAFAADYLTQFGGLMGNLASQMDQTNRDQFDAAKALNIGQAVMSTAAGIMQAYSQLGPIYGTPMAAMIAAVGALQVQKIASTQYGSGSSAPAFSGSTGSYGGTGSANFGGVGANIGSPTSSVRDLQSYDSLKRLADASDNAALAVGKLADGVTKVSDLFASGSMANAALSFSPGINFATQDTKGWLSAWSDAARSLFSGKIGEAWSKFWSGSDWFKQMQGLTLSLNSGALAINGWVQYAKNNGAFGGVKNTWGATDVDYKFQSALNAELDKVKSQIARAAVIMGTTVNYLQASSIGVGAAVVTSGKTAEEISTQMKTAFEVFAGQLAQTMDGLDRFTYYGESAYDAAMRLAGALQTVDDNLQLVGASLLSSTLAGANSAYQLTDLFGGPDKFQEAIQGYFQAMFSETEQASRTAARAMDQVTAAFGEMNAAFADDAQITIPKTKDEFIALVDAISKQLNDVSQMSWGVPVTNYYHVSKDWSHAASSDRAQSLIKSLMDVSDAFATVQEQAAKVAKDRNSFAQDIVLRDLRVKGLTAEADLMKLEIDQRQELVDAKAKGYALDKLIFVQEREKLQVRLKSLSDLGQYLDGSLSALGTLKNMLTSDASLSPLQRLTTARSSYETLFTQSLSGSATLAERTAAANQIGGAAQGYLDAARNYFGSGQAYQDIFSTIQSGLWQVGGGTGAITVDRVQQQINYLSDIRTAITDGNLQILAKLSLTVETLQSYRNFLNDIALTARLQQVA